MKNLEGKIANIQLETNPSCSYLEKEFIFKYWEISKKFDWVNTIKTIKNEYSLSNSALVKIIQAKSSFSFYVHCNSCNSFEYKVLSSRSTTYSFFCNVKKANPSYKCQHCQDQLQVNLEKEKYVKEEKEKRFQKLVQLKAIENQVWKNFSKFDQTVLKNCIDFNNFDDLKRYYKNYLSENSYKNLFKSLKALSEKNLIQLILDNNTWGFWIIGYGFHPNLKDKVITETVTLQKPLSTRICQLPEQFSNELKFRLTIDSRSNHFEKPRFAGTVKFPSDIILSKDVKYSFAAWEKNRDELFLTFIPVEKTNKQPIQKRIHEEPKHIQDIVDDIFVKVYFK